MKNSKKTWGMLGTSMGSMLIIVALLTMVGMGSKNTYAARKICTCKNGTLDSATQTCTYEKEVEYTCKKDTPGAYHCVAVGVLPTTDYDCTCKKTVPKTEAASCREIDDPGGDDDRYDPSEVNPDGSSTKPSTWKCASNQYKSGTSCKPCPDNATCDGISFSCPSEKYEKTGSGCTPKDPPKDPTDYGKSECETVNAPCTIHGRTGICTLTGGKKLCQITTSPSGGDDDDDKPSNPNKPTGGDDDDKPSNPNKPSGGDDDDKPSNPTTPTGGGDGGSGGNGGGNSGGNSGGNTGGNNGNNNGGNNANKNPNTATKTPLVIAIIGIISVGISSVVYFNGKKEINTKI